MTATGNEELQPGEPPFRAAPVAFVEGSYITVSDSASFLVKMPQKTTQCVCFGNAFLFPLAWENLW